LRDVPHGQFEGGFYKGNRALLEAKTPRRALRISRRATDAEIAREKDELTGLDGVVFSTFFSPGERVCLKTLLAGAARIVWVLPMAMPRSISADWTDVFLEDRALWVSLFPEEEATRASCEQANLRVEKFCSAEK